MIVMRILGALVAVIAVLGAGFLLGMRAKYAPVQDAVRRMNRRVWNPRALEDAGAEGSSASVIRHVGRTSGRSYETPVGVYLDDGAIYIALPYGPETDWIKNLAAAGGGEVVHDGATYTVGTPEVVTLGDARDLLSPMDQRIFRAFKVDEILRLPILAA